MDRRGVNTWDVVIGAVIAILTMAVLLYFLKPTAVGIHQAGSCSFGGGQCLSECGDDYYRIATLIPCQVSEVCCAKKSSILADDQPGSARTGGTGEGTPKPLTKVSAATLKLVHSTDPSKGVSTDTIYLPASGTSKALDLPKYVARGTFQYHTACISPSRAGAVCPHDWYIRFVVMDQGRAIEATYYSFSPEFERETPLPDSGDKAASSIFSPTAVHTETTSGDVTTRSFFVTFEPAVDQSYAGHNLQIIVSVFPIDSNGQAQSGEKAPIELTALEARASMQLKISTGVAYTGLDQQWSTKKSIRVACDSGIACKTIAYDVKSTSTECSTPSGLYGVQSSTNENTPLASCEDELMRYASPVYASVANLVTTPVMARSGAGASFTLQDPNMEGKFLCVYAVDDRCSIHSAGGGQKIMIDTNPPKVTASFNPIGPTVKIICADTESGCRQQYSYAYVTTPVKYFQSLFTSSADPRIYCPPADKPGLYKTESRSEFTYLDKDLRVMCVRAEDQAGNANIAMLKVYNVFALAGGSLAAITQG